MPVKIAIVYYSSTGCTHKLATAIAEGAREAGGEVRLVKAQETAPEAAVAGNEAWKAHRERTNDIPEATLGDLEWADALIFGSPTRYGNVASQLRAFVDTTGGLWAKGAFKDKVASAFCTSATAHGGQETTALNLLQMFLHWGCLVVSPGYLDPLMFKVGNPYGVSYATNNGTADPSEDDLAAARFQGRRVVETAARLAVNRPDGVPTQP